MKTGTAVHRAIDMAVVMCLSEKMHYQLSHLSPPTSDGGAGVRAREAESWDAQAEAGMDWTPLHPAGWFWARLERILTGRSELRVSGQPAQDPRLVGDQAVEEEGLWQYIFCCHRKSLRQSESSLSGCNLNLCVSESIWFLEMYGPEKSSHSTGIYWVPPMFLVLCQGWVKPIELLLDQIWVRITKHQLLHI
jgi:hypothetical protein